MAVLAVINPESQILLVLPYGIISYWYILFLRHPGRISASLSTTDGG